MSPAEEPHLPNYPILAASVLAALDLQFVLPRSHQLLNMLSTQACSHTDEDGNSVMRVIMPTLMRCCAASGVFYELPHNMVL
jgi:hypothetical protein